MIRQRWMYTTLTTLTLAAFASVAAAFEDDAMPGAKAESSAFVNGVLEKIRDDGTWQRLYEARLEELGPSPGPPAPRYED